MSHDAAPPAPATTSRSHAAVLAARVCEALDEPEVRAPEALERRLTLALERALGEHLEAMEQRVLRAERLAYAGQLAAGVAHELRNPLSVIETSAFILGDLLPEEPRARRHLQRIVAQVTLASGILNDLLESAREHADERLPVDLAVVAREALAQSPRPAGVTVELCLPSGLPPVLGDARRLRQVVTNLLQNAWQALGSSGRVEVTATAREGRVEVAVRDHGPGIPEALLARVFEPLVSTRRQGVGLGLALSRGIAEAHGGTLTAENAPEGGARFTLSLPMAVVT